MCNSSLIKKAEVIIIVVVIVCLCFTTIASMETSSTSKLVAATRLHLGKATSPPSDLESKLNTFYQFCQNINNCTNGLIAVDAEEKIPNYNLVSSVRDVCTNKINTTKLHIIPVQPWGKFVPALNALLSYAATMNADYILFVSAETNASDTVINTLLSKMDENTLVAGAVLPGHDYHQTDESSCIPISGRTSPWNTLAIWNIHKLSLTGFNYVSEGIHNNNASIAGIEEVATICILQKILGPGNAKAKLVKLDSNNTNTISWDQNFNNDTNRKLWHEQKMQSKIIRAQKQMDLLGLNGVVYHC